MYNFIRNLFGRRARFLRLNNGVAEIAFTYKGKDYYQFKDPSKLPAGRGLASLAVYEELNMRCTREYLLKHIAKTEEILNPADKRINLSLLAQINQNLKERLNLAPFPDHIFKLASVMFFDSSEDPNDYDFKYNAKKIESWKKDPDVLYFFLQTPLKDLMPFGTTSRENAENYFGVAEKINQFHLNDLLDKQSKKS